MYRVTSNGQTSPSSLQPSVGESQPFWWTTPSRTETMRGTLPRPSPPKCSSTWVGKNSNRIPNSAYPCLKMIFHENVWMAKSKKYLFTWCNGLRVEFDHGFCRWKWCHRWSIKIDSIGVKFNLENWDIIRCNVFLMIGKCRFYLTLGEGLTKSDFSLADTFLKFAVTLKGWKKKSFLSIHNLVQLINYSVL